MPCHKIRRKKNYIVKDKRTCHGSELLDGGQEADLARLHVENGQPDDRVAVEAARRRVQVLVLEPVAQDEYELAQVRLQLHVKRHELGVLHRQALTNDEL